MPATVIVGLQWGDEGKGKTTDFLAEQVAMVVRYQGGDNAGHTVVLGDEVFKLHLVPSGVLYPHITSVIGTGVVVNPATLLAELDMLGERGIDDRQGPGQPHGARDHAVPRRPRPRPRVAPRRREGRHDAARHRPDLRRPRAGGSACGWRTCSSPSRPPQARARCCPSKNALLAALGRDERFEVEPLVAQTSAWGERLRDHLADGTWLVQDALAARRPRAARGRPGHAPRPRPRQLPVRDLLETRSPAAPARAAASARSRSTRSSAS